MSVYYVCVLMNISNVVLRTEWTSYSPRQNFCMCIRGSIHNKDSNDKARSAYTEKRGGLVFVGCKSCVFGYLQMPRKCTCAAKPDENLGSCEASSLKRASECWREKLMRHW